MPDFANHGIAEEIVNDDRLDRERTELLRRIETALGQLGNPATFQAHASAHT